MGGVQVDERPAAVVGQRLGVGFQARRLGFEERARVLEQNVAAVQVALERSRGEQRIAMALENQASSDRAGYRIPVQITESGHVDLARVRWFTSSAGLCTFCEIGRPQALIQKKPSVAINWRA